MGAIKIMPCPLCRGMFSRCGNYAAFVVGRILIVLYTLDILEIKQRWEKTESKVK